MVDEYKELLIKYKEKFNEDYNNYLCVDKSIHGFIKDIEYRIENNINQDVKKDVLY